MQFKQFKKPIKPKFKSIDYKSGKPKHIIPEVPFSLNVEVSENYQGVSDSILGVISSLPKELKSLLGNAELNSVKTSHNYSVFVLDNRWYLKIKDSVIGLKKYSHITIKENNKLLFDKHIRWN